MIHYLQDGSISIGFMVKSAFFKHLKTIVSVIQDLYNGEVKGYQISRSQNQDLILRTLKKAINPNKDLSKLLIHSDQAFYTNHLNIVITLRNHHLLNP